MTVRSFAKGLETACAWVAGMLFLVVFLLSIAEVAQRYLLGQSIVWVSDLSRLLFVWIVMLGAAAAFHQGEHLSVAFIKDAIPLPYRGGVELFTRVLFGVMLWVLIFEGLVISRVRMGIDYVQLGWPSGLAFYAVPVSAAGMIFFLLISIWDLFRGA